MRRKRALTGGLLVALLLVLAVGPGRAQGPEPHDEVVSQAVVGTGFTYQGRLESDGEPVSDDCEMAFQLFDGDAPGGDPVGAAIMRTVTIEDGLFTEELDFGPDRFLGEARWLGIRVMCPGDSDYADLGRQALTAVPYAQYAVNVAPHDHWGETWRGGEVGLTLESGYRHGLAVTGGSGVGDHGVQVWSAGEDGVHISSAADDGVYVDEAGTPSTSVGSGLANGFEVDAAQGNGLFVGVADQNGVRVRYTGGYGVYVGSAGTSGLKVESAVDNGVQVDTAGENGLVVYGAGVAGVRVSSAGTDGLLVESANDDGVQVSAAANDGVYVYDPVDDGVQVSSAGGDGVYANTDAPDQEWGLSTPDKIWAGAGVNSSGAMMVVAQSGDPSELETGDVVAISGMGAGLGEGDGPVPLVRRADEATSTAAGVVYRRFVVEEEVSDVAREGGVGRETTTRVRSDDGRIAPGDHLLIAVLGPAQVKADTVSGGIHPGDVLAAPASAGRVTKAEPLEMSGTAFYAPGTIIGKAMEPLDAAEEGGLIWVWVTLR